MRPCYRSRIRVAFVGSGCLTSTRLLCVGRSHVVLMVLQRTRPKNEIQAVLIVYYRAVSATGLFSKKARAWLDAQRLPLFVHPALLVSTSFNKMPRCQGATSQAVP